MTVLLNSVGIAAGTVLAVLLLTNLFRPRIGMWPAAVGSWQSTLFWLLFRVANVSALASGISSGPLAGKAEAIQALAAAVAATIAGLYVWSCVYLGRDNLYCGRAGLVTTGIYRWTRNPQYAAAMPAYIALAVSAFSPGMVVLSALLVVIFHLMALNEEPWLEATYGDRYIEYRQYVPRYYNISRLIALLRLEARRLRRQLSYH